MLPAAARARLRHLAPGLDAEGRIFVTRQGSRSQHENLKEAMATLAGLLARSLKPPRARIHTKPGPSARERRLETKRKESARKVSRRRPAEED